MKEAFHEGPGLPEGLPFVFCQGTDFLEPPQEGRRSAPNRGETAPDLEDESQQVQVQDGLSLCLELIPQQRRAGVDQIALHACPGDHELALLPESPTA